MALPPGVVTEIGPVLAPFGTMAVIVCESTTVKAAVLPPNITLVAPVKFVPVIVTCVPTGPLGGVKLVIVGAGITVKLVPLVAKPPGVVTVIGPEVAPIGTVAVIFMPVNLNDVLVPLNVTEVALLKFAPLIVTEVPTLPLAGVKPVIVGGRFATTVKFVELIAVPPPVVTATGPVVAPEGTVAAIWVSELTVKAALVPLKVTEVAPVNAVPLIVNEAPIPPLVGLKPVMVGTEMTVKFVPLIAVPPPVVTATGPVLAPEGTVAVI
jgi:hypothetical protein